MYDKEIKELKDDTERRKENITNIMKNYKKWLRTKRKNNIIARYLIILITICVFEQIERKEN